MTGGGGTWLALRHRNLVCTCARRTFHEKKKFFYYPGEANAFFPWPWSTLPSQVKASWSLHLAAWDKAGNQRWWRRRGWIPLRIKPRHRRRTINPTVSNVLCPAREVQCCLCAENWKSWFRSEEWWWFLRRVVQWERKMIADTKERLECKNILVSTHLDSILPRFYDIKQTDSLPHPGQMYSLEWKWTSPEKKCNWPGNVSFHRGWLIVHQTPHNCYIFSQNGTHTS